MLKLTFGLLFLLLACPAWGAEDTDRLNKAAKAYIVAKSPDEKEAKAWEKKFKSRVEQRAEDSKLGRDEAAQSVAFDWLSDRSSALKAKEEKAMLELCRVFKWLDERGIAIPGTVLDRLRECNNMDRLASWLETGAKSNTVDKPAAK